MRHDAPFIVKRYAPMIGRPMTARRVTVAYQAYTLDAALAFARNERDVVTRLAAQCDWLRPATLWIEQRGQTAALSTRKGRAMTDRITYLAGDYARRATNGARVRILEAIPNGLEIFYKVEYPLTGTTVVVRDRDLRPDVRQDGHA
jgi:hypothetical protein